MIQYIGPLLICLYIFWEPECLGNNNELKNIQIPAFWLIVLHFSRRIFEVIFVHSYPGDAIPLADFLLNFAQYWLLFGIGIPCFLFNSKFEEPFWDEWAEYPLIIIFLLTELMNCCCHFVLMMLRTPNSYANDIPYV